MVDRNCGRYGSDRFTSDFLLWFICRVRVIPINLRVQARLVVCRSSFGASEPISGKLISMSVVVKKRSGILARGLRGSIVDRKGNFKKRIKSLR